ncbi:ras guanine nucleotide exchange factor domain-containing protein [Lactifluus subvellereus]|nr:ras guanine nucleotide exchange factor domain-containing protein [Lactifluus subvellereus]
MATTTAVYRTLSSPSSSTATTRPTSTLLSDTSLSHNRDSRMEEQQFITTFFCRAKYDYQSTDDASLSFRRGNIIEVLTRLETGWWDGLLGEERGWFPSNYVDIISDEEADVGLAAMEFQQQQPQPANIPLISTHPLVSQSTSTQLGVSISSGVAQSRSQSDLPTSPDADTESSPRNGHSMDELATVDGDGESLPSDFWVPRVTQDGQIYYVNTQTGQHSRDLPVDAEGDLSDVEFRASAQRLRPEVPPDPHGRRDSTRYDRAAGFGLPKRTGTPEPWVRRLADDGLSYFYLNKADGSVQWTLPEATAHTNGHTPPSGVHAQNDLATAIDPRPHSRQRSDSAYAHPGHPDGFAGNGNVYSDDSDVDPIDKLVVFSIGQQNATLHGADPQLLSQPTSSRNPSLPRPPIADSDPLLTSAEKLAQALQHNLAPAPPDSVTVLSTIARQSVAAIVTAVQSHDALNQPLSQTELEDRISDSVVAIRHLLNISSPPYGHVPSNLYVGHGASSGPSIPQSLQAQLKPAQRRVTATLSKLVLAALAAQYDTKSLTSEVSERMETDAAELDRALVTFVTEVQRVNNQIPHKPSKRLFAALLPTNIGLGLMGAGSAGAWKGFGWVALDTQHQPQRDLSAEVLAELKIAIAGFEERLVDLHSAVFDGSAAEIDGLCQSAIAWLHSVLSFIADVNLARTVDVDGINREGQPGDAYLQSVHKARALVRTVEAHLQSLYDDGASLLLAVTTPASLRTEPISPPSERIRSLTASLKNNVVQAFQTLEALLSIGQDQAAKGPSDYRGSIEWRMSRIINIDSNLGRTLKELALDHDSYDESEDVVDLEHALGRRPGPRPSTSLERSQSSSALYSNPSQTSESSLEALPRALAESAAPPLSWTGSSPTTPPTPPSAGSDAATGLLDDEDAAATTPLNAKAPAGAAAKLLRVLGDAPTHLIDQLNAKTKPWYLRPNYEESEIQIEPDGKVRAGTVPALVERLTAHEHSDTTFTKTFLLTYKSFTDVETLFSLLVDRFSIKPPETLSGTELEDWTKHKQHIIRWRVLNTFKTMITDEDALAEEDLFILDKMKDMVSGPEVTPSAAAKQLLVLIERAVGRAFIKRLADAQIILQKKGESRTKTAMSLDPQPMSIIPKASKKLKLLDFDPLEVARQLTMIECQLYMKIRPSECLMRSREQRSDNNDNIASIIVTTNKIAHWVADTVLSKEDSRKRMYIVRQFISIADRCRDLKNFSSMIAIVSGLNSPPIRRLKRTWDQIPQKFMTMLGACEMTIDSNKNFSNYRSLLQRITPPCVPFIGLYLTTLTFIQDGAPNNIGTLVNFRKRQKAAEVIEEIQKWQSKPFNFAKVDLIHDYIMDCLNKFNNRPDVSDEFWNLSLEREPREREDEKMARLLQETGFL